MRHGFPFLFMAWWVDKMGLLNPAVNLLNGNEMYWHTTLTDVWFGVDIKFKIISSLYDLFQIIFHTATYLI